MKNLPVEPGVRRWGRRGWLISWGVVCLVLGTIAGPAPKVVAQDVSVPGGVGVARRIIGQTMGNGHKIVRYMLPMRDGVEIATDVVFPKGEGPWPVLLFRTPYGRGSSIDRIDPMLKQGIAYVTQDFRGLWDSDGDFDFFSHEIDDGYDSVRWVMAQAWCNGKVAMQGGSGPGMGAKMAMIGNPPGLVAASTSVAASNIYHYCLYQGGVLRANMNDSWRRGQGIEVADWPRPRTEALAPDEGSRMLSTRGGEIQTALYDVTGWFDIFLQSSLDDFVALGSNPNKRLVIGGRGHGRMQGLKMPPNATGGSKSNAWIVHWLKGTQPSVLDEPPVRYYLMGDVNDEWAPGNIWKTAEDWPVPHTPTPFYFQKDGGLSRTHPTKPASLTYAYDPRDPVPTIGGANLSLPKGPMDQRPLKDRDDVLRFVTAPLEQPLEITGRVLVELGISTDVKDTTFTAKLIDVYPDGYEALLLDSAVMARYWAGLDRPQALDRGKEYALTIDLWSTAIVFNKGHRIAVHISSSNAPRFEPHPNTYDPADSYNASPVAHNTVHLGGARASRIILPVIEARTGK